MNRRIFLLIFIIVISFASYSQKLFVKVVLLNKIARPNSDTIYYNVNRKLTWDDFKGAPVMNHFGGAVTASGFAFNADMNMVDSKVNLNIYIYTFFDKQASWKKPTVNSAYHLLHEQHHFDITRLSAAKLCEDYNNANFTMANYQKLLSSIFDKVFKENSDLQNQYDSETNHSINTAGQEEWNNKIDLAVKTL
jgi:hypothetical protein